MTWKGTAAAAALTAIADVQADADAASTLAGQASDAAAAAQNDVDAIGALRWSMAVYGGWAIDGDGVRGAGGGICGYSTSGLTLSEVAAFYAQVDDGGVFSQLSSAGAARVQHKLFPDTPANNDALYIGSSVRFCEFALDMGTNASYTNDAITWEYYNGSTWAALTIAQDNTNTSTKTGTRPGTRDGAIHFTPPTAWALTTVNSQSAYWIRARVTTSANMGTVGIMNAKRPETVAPSATAAFECQSGGTVTGVRVSAGGASLGNANDTKFILMNFSTGLHSGELTWTKNTRSQSFAGLSLVVSTGNVLGVVVIQEDGTTEHSNVLMEMTVTPS